MTDYEFHPAANVFPLMEGEEFDALVADIKANGLREPIVTLKGKILDGRNRYRACLAAGVKPEFAVRVHADTCLMHTVKGIEDGYCEEGEGWIKDPIAYVISANIRRRHLAPEDKDKVIADLLKMRPEASNRAIGKMVNADHHKVAKVRKKEEDVGNLPHVSGRIDTKGRKQPAKKKPKPEPKRGITSPAPKKTDPETAAIIADGKIAKLKGEIADLKAALTTSKQQLATAQKVLAKISQMLSCPFPNMGSDNVKRVRKIRAVVNTALVNMDKREATP